MSAAEHKPDTGLGAIGREVADDAVRLVRAEIALAKAELREAAIRLGLAIGLFTAAALFLLIGLIEMLGAVPAQFGPQLFHQNWLGWVAFGALFFIAALLLAFVGNRMRGRAVREGKQTFTTFKEDAEWVKELTRRSGSGS